MKFPQIPTLAKNISLSKLSIPGKKHPSFPNFPYQEKSTQVSPDFPCLEKSTQVSPNLPCLEKKAPTFPQTLHAWNKESPCFFCFVFTQLSLPGKKHPRFPKLSMPGKKSTLVFPTLHEWEGKKSTPVFPNFSCQGKKKKAPQFSQALRLYKPCWMNKTHTETPTNSQVYLLCCCWKWTQLGLVQFCCCCCLCQTCLPLPAENFPITSVVTFLHTNINLITKGECESLSVCLR